MEQGVEALEVRGPQLAEALRPARDLLERLRVQGADVETPLAPFPDEPGALQAGEKLPDIAGPLMANGLDNSLTVASPRASRRKIARRVGSAKAENVTLRESLSTYITKRLANQIVTYKEQSLTPIQTAAPHARGLARTVRARPCPFGQPSYAAISVPTGGCALHANVIERSVRRQT